MKVNTEINREENFFKVMKDESPYSERAHHMTSGKEKKTMNRHTMVKFRT